MNDVVAQQDARLADLEIADQAAKAAGTLVGRYIKRQQNDGFAYYRITHQTSFKVTVEHVDIDDGWEVSEWGQKAKIALAAAKLWVGQRDTKTALFKITDDFWNQTPVGSTIHYAHGSGQFVRGIIIEHEGERKMKPTTLVGQWRQSDIYRRMPDGAVEYGYHAKMIIEEQVMQPNAETIVEFPRSKIRGADPRPMKPLSLTPEDMSKDELVLAANVRLYNEVQAALRYQAMSNPISHNKLVVAALRAAKRVLASVED